MTREEAINKLTECAKDRLWGCGEYSEALAIAIQALSQEPSGDAISRQAIINECLHYADHEENVRCKTDISDRRERDAEVIIGNCFYFKRFVEKLPSVQPISKTGHWVHKGQGIYCSECGKESGYNPYGASRFSDYCPNCGARMESEQNE